MLVLENIVLAIVISILSHLKAEIRISGLEAAIFDFPLPVWWDSI